MANQLNLRHTLLEFDLQGNLTIFNNGRSARLLASEVRQLLTWLATSKEQQLTQMRTERNRFKLTNGTMVVNDEIRILPPEVQQMNNWIHGWQKTH